MDLIHGADRVPMLIKTAEAKATNSSTSSSADKLNFNISFMIKMITNANPLNSPCAIAGDAPIARRVLAMMSMDT